MSQDHCCDMDVTWSGGALYTVFLQTSLKAVLGQASYLLFLQGVPFNCCFNKKRVFVNVTCCTWWYIALRMPDLVVFDNVGVDVTVKIYSSSQTLVSKFCQVLCIWQAR